MLNIKFLGDTNVGKTSILKRYCSDKFDQYQPVTIGVDF